MNKESLIKAREIIIQSLSESNINNLDKLELMLNINNFLQENEYEENIKVLVKKNKQEEKMKEHIRGFDVNRRIAIPKEVLEELKINQKQIR